MEQTKTEMQIAAEEYHKYIEDPAHPFTSWEAGLVFSSYRAGWNAKPEIKWKKIDPDNLPKGMVAALGDNNPVDILIGRIKKDRKPYCEIPSTSLWITATHYIPVSELLSLQKEQ